MKDDVGQPPKSSWSTGIAPTDAILHCFLLNQPDWEGGVDWERVVGCVWLFSFGTCFSFLTSIVLPLSLGLAIEYVSVLVMQIILVLFLNSHLVFIFLILIFYLIFWFWDKIIVSKIIAIFSDLIYLFIYVVESIYLCSYFILLICIWLNFSSGNPNGPLLYSLLAWVSWITKEDFIWLCFFF